MEEIGEGKSSRIFKTPFGVIKIAKRRSKTHDTMAQRRIHAIAEKVLSDPKYTILRVPVLSTNLTDYEMKGVNTTEPLWMPTGPVANELVSFWREMWTKGFALYDFELYVQPDGTVILLDFDSTGLRMSCGNACEHVTIPGKPVPPANFFIHPSFPPDFETHLQDLRLPIGKRNI